CKNVPKKKNDSDEIAFAIVGKRKRLKCPLTEANGDQATDVCWWFTNENGTKMHNLNNNNDSIYVINSTFLTILWNRVTLNDTAFLCQSSDGRIWEFKFDCNNATVCNHRGKCIEKHVGTPMHSVHCICSSSNYRGEYCEITKSPYPYFITIIFTCPIIGIVWLLLHGENPKIFARYTSFECHDLLPRCQWAVAALNHMDSAIQERLTAKLGDDINDYETSSVVCATSWGTNRRFRYLSPRGGGEDLNDRSANR
ncbi:hypothetical protein T01_2199, partial [Trichinella spiralis]